jgi:hypothetical protein
VPLSTLQGKRRILDCIHSGAYRVAQEEVTVVNGENKQLS